MPHRQLAEHRGPGPSGDRHRDRRIAGEDLGRLGQLGVDQGLERTAGSRTALAHHQRGRGQFVAGQGPAAA